jgi:hypothetical protein
MWPFLSDFAKQALHGGARIQNLPIDRFARDLCRYAEANRVIRRKLDQDELGRAWQQRIKTEGGKRAPSRWDGPVVHRCLKPACKDPRVAGFRRQHSRLIPLVKVTRTDGAANYTDL